jgi:hypothetical protein
MGTRKVRVHVSRRVLVITRALFGAFGATVAIIVGVAVATPVNADPSAFRALSCSCAGQISAAVRSPSVWNQMNDGIESGLADLQGIAG